MSPAENSLGNTVKYPGISVHFSELLAWHLRRGTNPKCDPDTYTGSWEPKSFGMRVSETDSGAKNVSNWLAGTVPQLRHFNNMVKILFCSEKRLEKWKEDFVTSYRMACAERDKREIEKSNQGGIQKDHFTATIPDPINKLERAVDLSLHEPPQGCSQDSFDLLADLRFGQATQRIDSLVIGFGIKKAHVFHMFTGCFPAYTSKLGRDGRSPFIIDVAGGWEVVGPTNTDGLLKGNPLGGGALCRLSRKNAAAEMISVITVNAYESDIRIYIVESKKAISDNKRVVIEQFIKSCIDAPDGTIQLSSAEIRYGENSKSYGKST